MSDFDFRVGGKDRLLYRQLVVSACTQLMNPNKVYGLCWNAVIGIDKILRPLEEQGFLSYKQRGHARYVVETYFYRLMREWPKSTRSSNYPIPASLKDRDRVSAMLAFQGTGEMFDDRTEYGWLPLDCRDYIV